jgi:Ala-tRNA(Pro) deacylase
MSTKVLLVPDLPSPTTPEDLLSFLDGLGIETNTVEHPAVFTVDEARRLRGELPGAHSKSLFLRNKKGRMWLVVTLEDRKIDLKDLGESLNAGRFSFGSAERLMRYLGVIPGAVTPFGAINDQGQLVQIALDREMLEHEPLNFHPLDNTKTTAISTEGLLRFLQATGHDPEVLDFDDE